MQYKITGQYIGEDPRDWYLEIQVDDHAVPMRLVPTKAILLSEGMVVISSNPYWNERVTSQYGRKVLKGVSDDPELFKIYRKFCLQNELLLSGDGVFLGDE